MVISHEALKYVIGRPFSGTPITWKSSILRFVVTELGKARRNSSQYDSDRLSTRRNRVCEMGIHAAEKKLTCHRWWRGKESSWIPGWNYRFSWSLFDFCQEEGNTTWLYKCMYMIVYVSRSNVTSGLNSQCLPHRDGWIGLPTRNPESELNCSSLVRRSFRVWGLWLGLRFIKPV